MGIIMLYLLIIFALANTSRAPVKNEGAHLTGNFLTGFETGIVLRKSPEQMKEYACPKAEIKMEEFRKVKDLLPAVTNIIKGLNKDDVELAHMLQTVEVLLDHMDELIGVFDMKYNGGDFCAGLTFGSKGSELLFKMAETFIHQSIKDMKAKAAAQ